MASVVQQTAAGPGDLIEVSSRHVGDTPRLGEIVEVLGPAGHAHYRVRWDDGHESVLYPGSDSRVLHMRPKAPKRRS